MSSLWTPSGEHQPREERGPGTPSASPVGPPAGAAGQPMSPEDLSPEEQAQLAAELQRMRSELSATPVVDIAANHAVGLWQLAVLHLTPGPDTAPSDHDLDEARLAIDAFAALVEGLGARFGPHAEALREALTQLRLAYVEVSGRLD